MEKLFFCFNHQNKARAFIRALLSRGWLETKDPGKARFILSDMDIARRGQTLRSYHGRGIKVFLYPHGGIPTLFWDFPGYDYSFAVDRFFAPAPGHVEVMKAYGVPYEFDITGWTLCDIRPFRPSPDIRRVLFAPIHPNNNGFLCELDRKINRETFDRLLRISSICDFELIVRYLGDLRVNGLWRAGGIQYIQGEPNQSTEEIDRADLVVAHHTMLFLAIARGVPALAMGEAFPPRVGGTERELKTVRSWSKYRDLFMYPLDFLEGDGLEVMSRAARSDEDIREWKARMIGESFDPSLFVDRIEELLQ